MKLYRAVSPIEYNELLLKRRFRSGPNALGGKFFAESALDAAKWGDLLEGKGNYRIIEIDVPTMVADQFMCWEMLDSIGPARFAEFDQLLYVNFKEA